MRMPAKAKAKNSAITTAPVSYTHLLGQLFADLDGRAGFAHGKGLTVCIDGDEFHALEACVHHTIDGIVAGAAAADYLCLLYTSAPYRRGILRFFTIDGCILRGFVL